jgi:hypothetical protein
LEQNCSINSFDIYRPSWEYLKDCPKLLSISRALQANPIVRERKLKHGDEESRCEATSGSDNREWKREAKKESRPLGNKASKRRAEEEDIIANVTAKLSERSTGTTSGAAVAMANVPLYPKTACQTYKL